MNIHITLHRANLWLGKKYDFLQNVAFFLSIGYSLRRALAKARDTV